VFVRPSELRTTKWADIDLDASEWRYVVSKTKTAHLVPLSTQAIEILKNIQPLSGHGEFVFMGGHDPKNLWVMPRLMLHYAAWVTTLKHR
jgi:integrase